jgi:hypothetical protein
MTRSIFFAIFVLNLTSFAGLAQSNKYDAVKGSETPEFSRLADSGNCFVIGAYIVKTDHKNAEGENISVFKRASTANAKAGCSTKGKAYFYITDADNSSFYGLYGNFLFVNNGTSAEASELDVYDLVNRKSIAKENYLNDAKLVQGRLLIFDEPTNRKGQIKSCSQAVKWKREGGGVGWLQTKQLDLQTLKKTSLGTLRCYYME